MLHLRSENLICDASGFASEEFDRQSELVSFSMAFQFIMWMSIYFQCLDWISWSFTGMICSFLIKDQNFYSLSWNWENTNLSKALNALRHPFTPLSAWEMLLALLCGFWDHWQLLLVQSGCTIRIIISQTTLIQGNWDCCWWAEKGNDTASKSEFVCTANYAAH